MEVNEIVIFIQLGVRLCLWHNQLHIYSFSFFSSFYDSISSNFVSICPDLFYNIIYFYFGIIESDLFSIYIDQIFSEVMLGFLSCLGLKELIDWVRIISFYYYFFKYFELCIICFFDELLNFRFWFIFLCTKLIAWKN